MQGSSYADYDYPDDLADAIRLEREERSMAEQEAEEARLAGAVGAYKQHRSAAVEAQRERSNAPALARA